MDDAWAAFPDAVAHDPWSQFPDAKTGVGDQLKAAITDIPGEIYSAGKSALSTIGENLNPFSESRMTSIDRQSKSPSMLAGLGENIGQTLGVGKGLAAIPELATSPITGAARSAIGHPYSALTGMPYEQAKDAVDTAMLAIRPKGGTPRGLTSAPAPTPAATDLRSAASVGYDAAKNSGVELKPSAITTFSDSIKTQLNADGLNEVLAPKTFGVLDKLGTAPAGATVTTNDFRTLQRALGHAAKSPDPTERLAASRSIEALNRHVESLPPGEIARGTPAQLGDVVQTVRDANANYAASKRADTVAGKMERADLNAGSAHSGQNIDNATRQQIKTILTNPKLRRGYSAEELAQMEKIVRGTSVGNLTRGVGNLLGGGGGLGALASAGTGLAAAGPLGVAAPFAGFGLKKLGNALTARQVALLEQMILARSPLARSMPAVQSPAPSAMLSPAIPYQFSQGLPVFRGGIPAYADQDQPRRR